jgi:polysaccharide pyruvyl transferase WcaK-like protein
VATSSWQRCRGWAGDEAAVTRLPQAKRHTGTTTAAVRVGFLGLLGVGNLGNEGSLEAVLAYLGVEQPDAALDCLCTAPDEVKAQDGLPAAQMRWYDAEHEQVPVAKCMKVPLGMIIDAFPRASWVSRHAAIVPGMGVLEATLPVRPWHYPYSMFLLSVSGRLFRTKVAFVCVGSNVIRKRVTRQLIVAAARLAYYRSHRDNPAREEPNRKICKSCQYAY